MLRLPKTQCLTYRALGPAVTIIRDRDQRIEAVELDVDSCLRRANSDSVSKMSATAEGKSWPMSEAMRSDERPTV